MATVRDLLCASLVEIGALSIGENPDADDLSKGLANLNRMISRWSTEGLLIPTKIAEEFSLVANQQVYTMGIGGDFNTTRPQKIENAYLKSDNAFEFQIDIINKDQWAAIPSKTVTSSLPGKLYFDSANPLANLSFYPVPDAVKTVVLYSWKPLSQFTGLSQTVVLPEGYEDAIVFNFAKRSAASYGKVLSQDTREEAAESKAAIKRMNIKPIYLSCDDALVSPARASVLNWPTGNS